MRYCGSKDGCLFDHADDIASDAQHEPPDESTSIEKHFELFASIFKMQQKSIMKYEVANMDHSVMQGVEVVDRIILGTKETTWTSPKMVNL